MRLLLGGLWKPFRRGRLEFDSSWGLSLASWMGALMNIWVPFDTVLVPLAASSSDAAVSSGKSCKSTKEQNTSSSVHCACCLKQTTREEAVNYNNLEIPGEATTLLKAESISNQWSMPLMRETRR